ncbi:FYVE-domain-containing protein [Dothidotthia symphoricarpi CBS 119687]|uniref:RING-type E3 ubiquitin transferase n=1 Tax=Dothidotthia symphoricarpi CBS 119687 TaxID=1392245 RepID=A0A6A5ZY34_9PLEO|nr:FYVE-domain-containing protein [Dothidotthia symphoricarpi CBS 119687]KAF2124500.1 FYVE-domain-containing protein [Dothidotthia symphoricarpi CBS 119687]
MDRRQHPPRRTSLANQLDGASNNTDGNGESVSGGYPARWTSHFQNDAHEREAWMDFLLSDSREEQTHNQQSQPSYTSDRRSQSTHSSSHRQHPSRVQSDHPADHSPLTLPARPLPRADSSSSSSRSSDRKRRLTTADSPMRRPSSIRMHNTPAGNSSMDPIMLDSPPVPSRAPLQTSASSRPLPPSFNPSRPLPSPPSLPSQSSPASYRRGSDLVLPPWQPDVEVSQCPVCTRPFTFLFRKHHCRKCGRVVCSSCSPHRITIPRQFIVHPPTEHLFNTIDLTGDDDANMMSSFGPFRNPALGGGEEVRVCNPCVPDPNFSPPPQYNPSGSSRNSSYTHSARPVLPPPSQPPTRTRTHRSSSNVHDGSQTVGHGQTHRPRDTPSDRRLSYHSGALTGERWMPPRSSSSQVQAMHPQQQQQQARPSSSRPDPNAPSIFGLGSGSFSRPSMFPRPLFTSTTSTPSPALQPRPRRQIAEEDECPICGDELPPKSPSGDDSARTQHIEDCIALHSASPAPVSTMSLPTQRTRGMSNPAGHMHGTGGEGSNRATAARGMFPYVATEKDCTDNEGNEIECIICLEDFEAGDKMARLVCWCKFHEQCIKDWWEKKGRGACPTHQLQE